MGTQRFLEAVLPTQGFYIITYFPDGIQKGALPKQRAFATIKEASEAVRHFDGQEINTYFACASFKERRKGMRKADNAAYVRSQWADLDVDPTGQNPKKYASIREAAVGVKDFCVAMGLPAPMLVQSGVGVHCYWIFTQDVPADKAQPYMRAFVRAARHHGFKQDTKRATDIASVLRPVGSNHRKGTPLPVKTLHTGTPIDPDTFYAKLEPFLQDDTPPVVDDEWGTGLQRDYAPSYTAEIVKHCRVVYDVAKARGNVEEPLWRATLGLVKYTVEGEAMAHALSKGHPAYDPGETQQKLDNWTYGPATCEEFSFNSDRCASCKHNGQISSPIHLGYREEKQVTDPPAPTPAPAATATGRVNARAYARCLPSTLPFWPAKYRWDGLTLSKFQKDPDDPDAPGQWAPFLDKLLYPFMRFQDDEGEMYLRVSVLISPKNNRWKEFDIPAKALADNRTFTTALGAYEVYTMGQKQTVMARQFFQDVITGMQDMGLETEAYKSFGWQGDKFVIGTSALTGSGDEPVFLSDRCPSDAHTDFGVAGTSADWAQLVNEIYNRPGAEPYQFLFCAAFGAPLISLAHSDLWHGIPIALTGEGGLGKTTTCMAACSMYGQPGKFAVSTNELGSTMNALISRVSLMKNLPLVMDEMTGRKTEELQGMLYALSNGKPKERNRPDGSLIETGARWDTTTFITGNMNITAMLSQLDKQRAEATQLRCFEIPLADSFNEQVFAGLNAKEMVENRLLAQNYGAAGREYLQYVIKHRDAVGAQLTKLRSKMAPNSQDETRERFYLDAIATALVGGAVAKKLGLIDFDLNAIKKWAMDHVKSLRTNRVASLSTVEDYLGAFLNSLHGRTVVTDKFTDGRAGPVFEVDSREVRNPVARVTLSDKWFLVSHAHFMAWCSENNVHAKWFKEELDKRGILDHTLATANYRASLFKGTSLPSTQTRVIQFDFDALMSTGKVNHLKAV